MRFNPYLKFKRFVIYERLKLLRRKRKELNDKKRELEIESLQIRLSMVGLVVIHWGYIEMILDGIVHLFHRRGGDEQIQTDLPSSLKSEVAFLKKAIALSDAPADFVTDFMKMIAIVQNLKDFRNNLVHGIVTLNKISEIETSI